MKIIRFEDTQGSIQFARRLEDGSALAIEGDIFGKFTVTERPVTVQRLLTPVGPRAIIAIGLNYKAHAKETGAKLPQYPLVFLKLPGAAQDPEAPILLPRHLRSDKVDYECELAVVIGKSCKNVSKAEALDYVLGYTCANDVSARDWQKQWGGGQFCRGKTFDTFCPLGPCLVTTDEITDPGNLTISTHLNGKQMQSSCTSDMIFDVPTLIEFLSGSTTLEPGTVLITGTPSGVGDARKPQVYLQDGDTVTVEIEKIGRLTNPVRLEEEV